MDNKYVYWQDPETIKKLIKSLEKGKVSVAASDTVLGLLADTSQAGFDELNKVKKRFTKPYIILINSPRKLLHFIDVDFDDQLKRLINKCWPGPVTIIFKSKRTIPVYLKSFGDTIAIRIPKCDDLLNLLQSFEGLFSTSANISGDPVPEDVNELDLNIIDSVDYIVLDKSSKDNKYSVVPSTILDCTGPKIKLVREGVYPVKELEEIYGESFIRSSK